MPIKHRQNKKRKEEQGMNLLERCKTTLRLWMIPRLLGRSFSLLVLAPGNEALPLLPPGTTLQFKIYCEPGHVLLPTMILNQAPWRLRKDKSEYLLTFLFD